MPGWGHSHQPPATLPAQGEARGAPRPPQGGWQGGTGYQGALRAPSSPGRQQRRPKVTASHSREMLLAKPELDREDCVNADARASKCGTIIFTL